jgi:glycosyltransferase involved in cell wall biosynthesis
MRMEPNKKKVLFIITKSNWGGAQRYVYDLACAARERGHVSAVAFGGTGALAEKLHAADILTHVLPSLQREVSFGTDVKSFFELLELFRREHPNVVHLNSSKAGGVGALAARCARVPRIVFTAHGWPFWEKRSFLTRGVIWFFSWLTVLLSHITIVVSDYDLRVARRMPFVGKKVVRIYNGIKPMPLGSGIIIRNAFPPGVTITGTIGELNKNKNQIALIEQAKGDALMYVAIVGEGEDRSLLEAKVKEYHLETQVKLFGFVPAHEVLRGFDTFALPSLKEGLPYVLLEAKAAGLPIVANRVGGVGEILDAKDMSEFTLEKMVRETIAVYQ